MIYKDYEAVIGLEVHVELKTATKIFCSCKTDFGAEPNTQCCPVCMGMPGTLPVLNAKVVDFAVTAGLASNCRIARYSKLDRKNYFYPDLPKAYQISQYDLPLCEHGYLDIVTESGETKRIGITRIHIEEDAGKLVHSQSGDTLIDCNRCGVPLIEIVSEPDIRSAAEASAYVRKLRSVMLYTGVSDCRMNEGSLRCDVNLSVRKACETALGTRTEMKNLNSFRFIEQAVESEFRRQVDELESGRKIVQETRRFDPQSGKSVAMRRKENADDYRYFPDPDLPPIELAEEKIEALAAAIPELPDARMKRYAEKYMLKPSDSELLTADKAVADFFESAAEQTDYPKLMCALIIGEMLKLVDPDSAQIPLSPLNAAGVAQLYGEQTINFGTAKTVLKAIYEQDLNPEKYVAEHGLAQINDREAISGAVAAAISANPKATADYRNGKTAAIKVIIGAVMAKTAGRANPEIVSELAEKALR